MNRGYVFAAALAVSLAVIALGVVIYIEVWGDRCPDGMQRITTEHVSGCVTPDQARALIGGE